MTTLMPMRLPINRREPACPVDLGVEAPEGPEDLGGLGDLVGPAAEWVFPADLALEAAPAARAARVGRLLHTRNHLAVAVVGAMGGIESATPVATAAIDTTAEDRDGVARTLQPAAAQ